MKARVILILIALFTFSVAMTLAAPAPDPAPANPPKLSPVQDARLLDLSDAEANIQAINKALFRAGYKVGVAYDQIDSNRKGNELMDRKGGGPVRWDEFYGRTARGYASNGWGDRRPQQFDYIYKANNDKIRLALDKISAIQGNKSALLGRRRTHEENQSRLWAMLAFQQVHDREIFLDDLTQFALKPAGPEASALRPIILFLRTADRVAADGLDTIKIDQPATFRAGDERMRKAYADLQKSLADALGAPALLATRREKAVDIKALCKNLSEECEIAAGDYAKSLDSDAAGEDTTKLLSRARLQTALYTFASNVDELYDQVTKAAKEWNITGDKGTPTPDVVAAVAIKAEPPAPARPGPNEESPVDALQPGTIWIGSSGGNGKIYLKLSILDRDGDTVRARFEIGSNIERIVSGRVKDGKFGWLAKDVRAVKGKSGGDNTASIRGDELDIEWHDIAGNGGSYILRLAPSSVRQSGAK